MENIGEFGEWIFDSPKLLTFYKSTHMIQLISHFVHLNMAPGSILKYFRPVGSLSFPTTQTLPDLDGSLSEKVPAQESPHGHRLI